MTVLPSTLSTCIQDTEQKWFGNEIFQRDCASETSSWKQTHTCGCSFPFLSSPCSKKQTNKLRLKSQQRAGGPIWCFCCIFPLKKQFDSSLLGSQQRETSLWASLLPARCSPYVFRVFFFPLYCIIVICFEILFLWKIAINDPHLAVTKEIRLKMLQGDLGEWTHGNNPLVTVTQAANWARVGAVSTA